MIITDKEIKRIASNNKNMQTGKYYYQQNFVESIDIEDNGFFGEYTITGVVNNIAYENECEIIVNEDNQIEEYHCDCYWCDEFSACGHVIAILLKVQELSPDFFPFHYQKEDKQSNYLDRIKEMRRQQEEAIYNQQISVTETLISDFKYEQSYQFHALKQFQKYDIAVMIKKDYDADKLKFKVGADKKYVIKNIPEFLDAITYHRYVKYGKQLAFVHDSSAFSEDALKVIDLMTYCLFVMEQEQNTYYYGHSHITNEIDILPNSIDQIYEVISSLNQKDININESQDYPILLINKKSNHYVLQLDEFDYLCGHQHLYKIDHHVITRIPLDEERKAMKFIVQCLHNDQLILDQKDVDDFIKYVFHDIKHYFHLSGDSLPEYHQNEESLTLYGDINDLEQIQVYLKSEQSEQTIYSFDHEGVSTTVLFDQIEDYLKDISDLIDYENHCMYMNIENKRAYQFLNEGLPFLGQYCDIMVSDALRHLGKKSQFHIHVGITIENDLLSIDVDSVDIPQQELAMVFNSYKKKKKFHRLKNGKLLYLDSDDLEELNDLMEDYHLSPQMLDDGHVDMNIYRALSLDQKANESQNLIFNRSQMFQDFVERFDQIKDQDYPLSKYYQDTLRDYQVFGYQWLQTLSSYGFGGILADDMGLGKTLQIIALLDENRANNQTSLVVCPSSLLLNWQDEIHKFSSTLTCQCVHGSLKKRQQAIQLFGSVDVLITTYDYIKRDYLLYQDFEFAYLILDEAQYIKNPKTKNAFSVKSLKASHRFALTGTPIENSLAEIWSIFDFLMPDYLYNYHYFQSHYETPIVKNHDEKKQAQLKKLISPFILRRNKKDVLKELPEKIEKTLILEFTQEERKLYLAHLIQVNKELQEKFDYENIDRIAILAMLTKLRQICCEPRLVYDNVSHISSKLEGCLDLIRNFQGNKQKVLLFSSFASLLDLIAEELTKENISFYKLTGQTSKKERHHLVEQFQNDETTVFLISLKAGGTGLNLTAAEAVIHYDPWWNMSAQNQATDRAHRIGQKNVVTVYKLVMKDSVEEKILQLQNRKKNLADHFVEHNEGQITTMSTEDMIELFKI